MPRYHHLSGFAPSKINLGLEILGRDQEGFHCLETLFHTLALGDWIDIRFAPDEAEETLLECSCPGLRCGPENAAWRAVSCLRQLGAGLGRVHLSLHKQIPLGGGLGGSSADAAAVLRLLQHRLPPCLSRHALSRAALKLGADVPFLLRGGACHALGRGEVLSPLPDGPAQALWLIIPPFACATPAVFAALTAAERGPRSAKGRAYWRARWPHHPAQCCFNRLWKAACRVQTGLIEIGRWLDEDGQPWGLSGSGSTCYRFCPPRSPPPPGVQVIQTRLLLAGEMNLVRRPAP